MHLTLTNSQKWKQLFNILLPILVTQLALSAMTFFDTNMSGHFSSADLAGVAIGVSLWVPVQTGLNGILIVHHPYCIPIGWSTAQGQGFLLCHSGAVALTHSIHDCSDCRYFSR